MKKVLVFIDWYTPAYKAGGPIRSVNNLINALGDDIEFMVVTGAYDFGDTQILQNIVTNEINQIEKCKAIFLTSENQNANEYQSIYDSFQPDYIYLNSLFSSKFTILPLVKFRNNKEKIVLAPRGMLGLESLKIKSFKKKVFSFVAKILSFFNGITWHATSSFEKQEIENHFGTNQTIKIAPNLPHISTTFIDSINKEKGKLNLISISRIVPIKNILFLIEVLQEVTAEVTLTFIGPTEDQTYWEKCQLAIKKLPQNITWNHIGMLKPNEISSYLENNHVYISPTLNENFGHSIAEAIGFGCPVIISDKTPWKNLQDKNLGYDLQLEKNKFIVAINYYAELDNDEFHVIRKQVRTYAVSELISQENLKTYLTLFE